VRRRRRRPDAARRTPAVPRGDRFGLTDLLTEATADLGTRPGRLAMTLLGTALGIGALVATVGFAQTSAGQLSRQFDAVSATQVTIGPAEATTADGARVTTTRLPWDSVSRLETLAGVESAATVAELALGDAAVTAVPVNDPAAPAVAAPTVVAASPGLIGTLGGSVASGRLFDVGHDERGDRVAVLGARAAERLGVGGVGSQPSIFVDGLAYAVVGVFDGVERRAELLDAVVVPTGSARADFGLAGPGEAQVRIEVGAGPTVAEQAPLALAPGSPDEIEVVAPRSGSDLAEAVQADVNLVFVIVSVIALLAGGLGIANVTMLSVGERTGEIGLRRAVGATRRQIAGQFVAESVVLGLLGGLAGAAVGVAAVVAVSVVQQWTPVVDPLIAGAGAVLGAVVGFAAGGVPARRASRIEPVDALRGS
jgi:putative ABC transport system permease protein